MLIGEVLRKAIHLFSIVIPVAAVIFDRTAMVMILLIIALILVLTDFLKLRHHRFKTLFLAIFGKVLREKEQNGAMTASTIVIVSAALTIFLFRQEIAVSALVFLIVGDAAAALVGRHFGHFRILGNRTLEGSAAMLTACLFASSVLLYVGNYTGWTLTVEALIVGSVVATIVELVEIPLDDNLRIPILAGFAMELILPG